MSALPDAIVHEICTYLTFCPQCRRAGMTEVQCTSCNSSMCESCSRCCTGCSKALCGCTSVTFCDACNRVACINCATVAYNDGRIRQCTLCHRVLCCGCATVTYGVPHDLYMCGNCPPPR